MHLRTNPRVPIVWASATSVRCGDSPHAETRTVSDQEAELLGLLSGVGIDAELLALAAADAGIGEHRLRRLLAFLAPALLTTRGPVSGPEWLHGELSDATTASRADELLARRAGHRIVLAGDPRWLHLCLWMLDHAGIEAIRAGTDRHSSSQQDAGQHDPAGAQAADPAPSPVGLLVSGPTPHPRLYRPWMREGVPHVGLSMQAHGATVSAIIRPGLTPCLRCRELWRCGVDPSWPFSAAQLSALPVPAVERTVAATAVGVAVATAIAFIDGEPSGSDPTRVHPYGVAPAPRERFHPACGCREFADWIPAGATAS